MIPPEGGTPNQSAVAAALCGRTPNRRATPESKQTRIFLPKQSNTTFICQSCGYQSRKWLGKCPECGGWNSLVGGRLVTTKKGAGRKRFRVREPKAVAYTQTEFAGDGGGSSRARACAPV